MVQQHSEELAEGEEGGGRRTRRRLGSRALEQLERRTPGTVRSAGSVMSMASTGLGRNRNTKKFSRWGFYFRSQDGMHNNVVLRKLRDHVSTVMARVPGGGPMQSVEMEKKSRTRVELSWPKAITVDGCIKVIAKALGENWKKDVTEPAGVPGSGAEEQAATAAAPAGEQAATAEAAPPAADSLEEAVAEVLHGHDEADAMPSEPSSLRRVLDADPAPPTARRSFGAKKLKLEGYLGLKLEAVGQAYEHGRKGTGQYEDLPCQYEVDWKAKLGEGSFGQVYLGTRRNDLGGLAVKMLRDDPDEAKRTGFNADAYGASDDEVKRHVALGVHQNLVRLLDVGLFRELFTSGSGGLQQSRRPARGSGWEWRDHIGLVFDLYEIDVRQFLQRSTFTQSGVRHVLNSVLEGLRWIHDRGCVHTDLKPANILMRGAVSCRGCFEKEALTSRQLGEWDPVKPSPKSKFEFDYQIPRSFEALGSRAPRVDLTGDLTQHHIGFCIVQFPGSSDIAD